MAPVTKELTPEQVSAICTLREFAAAVYQDSFVNAVLIGGLIGATEMLPYAATLLIEQYEDIRSAPHFVPAYHV